MKLAEFQKIADMLTREHRISIHEGQGWAADIQSRKIFYRKEDIYNLPEDHILGLLLHEVAHIHYTTDAKLPTQNKELIHTALNMVEDISIEHIISGDYPNAGEILESTKEEVLDTLIKLLPKLKKSLHEKALLYAAARFEGRGYSFGFDPYEKIGEKISQLMLTDKELIFSRKETKDLLPLIDKIVKLLLQEAGEPTPDQKQEMMREAMHGHANEQGQQNGGSGKNAGGKATTGDVKDEIIKSLKAGKGWKPGVLLSQRIDFIDEISDQAQQVGKQLRNVLKRNNAMEFGGRYRTGKLLTKRLVKIRAQKDRNPFSRRIIKSNQSYAFAIATDVSGSMFDFNFASYAMSSMHMVGEALKVASIPRSMIVFATRAKVMTSMGKAQIRWEDIADEEKIQWAGGGTQIEYAIDKCAEELMKTRAERKIMIVITDGSSDVRNMKESQKKASKQGIECLGITIGDEDGGRGGAMDQAFGEKKNIRVSDTSNPKLIGKAFIDILKASVKSNL